MNTFTGTIQLIETYQSLSLVRVKVHTTLFSAVVLETPDTVSYLKDKNTVHVLFKETEVVIGKGTDHALSMQNKIVGKVSKIEKGKLLSKITLCTAIGILVAIITSNALKQLNLREDEYVTALIKTNQIMLSK